MANTFRFYYCTVCGAMSVRNFRDDEGCRSCGAAMKVNQVTVRLDEFDAEDIPAPHTEDDSD